MGQGHSMQMPREAWDAGLCGHDHCISTASEHLHGSYLVRRSPDSSAMQLYVNDHAHVLQYDIKVDKTGVSCCGVQFPEMHLLLNHFESSGIQARSGTVALQQPIGLKAFKSLPYYLNAMDVPSWYVRQLPGDKALKYVKSLDRGRFIVRATHEPHTYQMLVQGDGSPTTVLIQENEDGSYQFGKRNYGSLQAVVGKLARSGVKDAHRNVITLRVEGDPPEIPPSNFFAGPAERAAVREFLMQPNMVPGSYIVHQSTHNRATFYVSVVTPASAVEHLPVPYRNSTFRLGNLTCRTVDELVRMLPTAPLVDARGASLSFVQAVAGTFNMTRAMARQQQRQHKKHHHHQPQQQPQQQQQQQQQQHSPQQSPRRSPQVSPHRQQQAPTTPPANITSNANMGLGAEAQFLTPHHRPMRSRSTRGSSSSEKPRLPSPLSTSSSAGQRTTHSRASSTASQTEEQA